jgi:hypothetical protein
MAHIIKLGLMNEAAFLGARASERVVIFLYPVYNSSLAALITLSRGPQGGEHFGCLLLSSLLVLQALYKLVCTAFRDLRAAAPN